MLLTVDVSNRLTGLVLWQADRAVHQWHLATDARRTTDELRWLLSGLLARDKVALEDIEGCCLASVVPDATPATATALAGLLKAPVLTVGPGMRTGLRIRTDDPREVGPDRVANALAAIAHGPGAAIVLDFATALTIDIVNAAGDYLGAIIAPGLEAAAAGLTGRTARLVPVELVPPAQVVAQSTTASLQSGCVLGYAGLVEGLLARAKLAVGEAKVIATGEAPWLDGLLDCIEGIDLVAPLLTHEGLRLLFDRQRAL
jgi:type III pantothenate kinase